jgi:hypothetical protein
MPLAIVLDGSGARDDPGGGAIEAIFADLGLHVCQGAAIDATDIAFAVPRQRFHAGLQIQRSESTSCLFDCGSYFHCAAWQVGARIAVGSTDILFLMEKVP